VLSQNLTNKIHGFSSYRGELPIYRRFIIFTYSTILLRTVMPLITAMQTANVSSRTLLQ